jgi:hypothetical protein
VKSPSWRLGRVEIPAERAGDQGAEQNAQRVESPALQLSPLAADHAPRVEGEVDAAVTERADHGHREKARSPAVSREIGAVREREAEPGDKPARGSARIEIGVPKPTEEGRRPVGAANDRLPEWKEERAAKRA